MLGEKDLLPGRSIDAATRSTCDHGVGAIAMARLEVLFGWSLPLSDDVCWLVASIRGEIRISVLAVHPQVNRNRNRNWK